jgi:hypothetical protein
VYLRINLTHKTNLLGALLMGMRESRYSILGALRPRYFVETWGTDSGYLNGEQTHSKKATITKRKCPQTDKYDNS